MIRILTPHRGPRLDYAADFIFRRVLRTDFRIEPPDAPREKGEAVLAYGVDLPENHLQVRPSGLISASGIPAALPKPEVRDGLPCLFPANDAEHVTGDIFSEVFFALSRAEEYLSDERDMHGRFPASASVHAPFREIPFIDRLIFRFGEILISKGMLAELPRTATRYINTLDIDIAYAYRGRSLLRTAGATGRDLLGAKTARLRERVAVLSGSIPDPFDTYAVFRRAGVSAHENICFILCGRRSGYDINLDPRHPTMSKLIRSLKTFAEVGIHPSYAALGDPERTAEEIKALERASGVVPQVSRQHFLRFKLPETFRTLSELGIRRDYSMGWADAVGFRSGTAYAHPFYDLSRDEVLPIELVPLHAMDSALFTYLGLSPGEASGRLEALHASILPTGGNFVTVWHNHSLSDTGVWRGARKVYTSFADSVRQNA